MPIFQTIKKMEKQGDNNTQFHLSRKANRGSISPGNASYMLSSSNHFLTSNSYAFTLNFKIGSVLSLLNTSVRLPARLNNRVMSFFSGFTERDFNQTSPFLSNSVDAIICAGNRRPVWMQ